MSGKVRDAANSVALHFDVRRHHLSDERRESAELHYSYFVLRWGVLAEKLGQEDSPKHTIDSQIAQSGTCSSLDLNVWVLEEEEDWFEGVSVHFPHIYPQH